MKIVIIGNYKKPPAVFSPIINSRVLTVETSQPGEYRKQLAKKEEAPTIIYLDAESFPEEEMVKEIRFLLRRPGFYPAIYDGKGKIDDPGSFLHQGIGDYIGRKCSQDKITVNRMKKILQLSSIHTDEEVTTKKVKTKKTAEPPYGSKTSLVPNGDWKKIKTGKSYVFCFLFIELDLTSEWKKKSGHTHLKRVKDTFHNYIQNIITPLNGKIWMWNEYGGLVLFPYDDGPCSAILASCKLMLNRSIASCEDFNLKTSISFRIGMHIGETVYQDRGKTGTIISDTVNFLFHLGQKYANPGNMYITKPMYEMTAEGLKDLFVEEGIFEDRTIFRLRELNY